MNTVQQFEAAIEPVLENLQAERYRQSAGLKFDKVQMERLAKEMEELSQKALAAFNPQDFPKLLLHFAIRTSGHSEYIKLQSEIHKKRNEGVAVTVDGEEVSLSNWRIFNRKHVHDYSIRHQAFDSLMEKAELLTPLLMRRFALRQDLLRQYDLTPLDAYLDEEQITLNRLIELVHESASQSKQPFQELTDELVPKVIGKKLEYYDDYYVLNSIIFEDFDALFTDVDFEKKMNQIFAAMGFDLSRISIDGVAREGKDASPVCWGIRVPQDARVLYQRTSPFSDFTSFCHEMGHALHFTSIREDLPFPDRWLAPYGVDEIFSTLFESIATDPLFLEEELEVSRQVIRDLKQKERFMELYYLTFYGANSMLKIKFWKDELSMNEADELYERLTEQYMGFKLPGRYWQAHHVVSMYDLYAPSYLLAKVRMEELKAKIKEEFGQAWWRNAKAGEFLREKVMGPGAKINLSSFSSLNERPYFDTVLQEPNL